MCWIYLATNMGTSEAAVIKTPGHTLAIVRIFVTEDEVEGEDVSVEFDGYLQ